MQPRIGLRKKPVKKSAHPPGNRRDGVALVPLRRMHPLRRRAQINVEEDAQTRNHQIEEDFMAARVNV